MITYESVEKFVEQCLTYAYQVPANAYTFQSQAFGAVSFAAQTVWQSQPELEAKLIQMWNDEWRNLFTQAYVG